MSKRPLKATDRRRNSKKHDVRQPESDAGSGSPLADLFNDRRKPNGHGKKAF